MIRRRTYAKLEKRVEPEFIQVHVKCGHCQDEDNLFWTDIRFELGGGCGGHGPEEYCYCEGRHYTATYNCGNCKKVNYIAFEDGGY